MLGAVASRPACHACSSSHRPQALVPTLPQRPLWAVPGLAGLQRKPSEPLTASPICVPGSV